MRVDGYRWFHAQASDLLDIAVQVSASFEVNDQDIRACFFKSRREFLRFFYHEMHVTDFLCCFSDMFNNRNSKTNIGYKSSVHHIEVKPICLTFIDHSTGIFQMKKIRG